MKDKRSLHLKVQELCDCYATTDPLKEMSAIKTEGDKEEAALKWLALAALHGVNANAERISITRSGDGDVIVKAEYRVSELPSPGSEIGEKIIAAAREITHLEGEKAKSPLALGIRDSSIDVEIKVKKDEKGEKLTLAFPK
jgi:hypothetical protein